MAIIAAHRRLAFWAASSIIAFALSFLLGAVWHRHTPEALESAAYWSDQS